MRTRILVLLALHALCGMGLIWLALAGHHRPLEMIGTKLLVGQLTLLAVWAVFGSVSSRLRLAGAASGLVYVWGVMAIATGAWYRGWIACAGLGVTVTIVAAIIWTGLAALRYWRPRVQLVANTSRLCDDGLRFTIRHLLILTTVVAILLGLGGISRNTAYTEGTFLPRVASVYLLDLACVALVSTWAGLGAGRLVLRLPGLLVFCVGAGVLAASWMHDVPTTWYIVFPVVNVLEALIVGGSLLVVRSCGYRLVRRTRCGDVGPTCGTELPPVASDRAKQRLAPAD